MDLVAKKESREGKKVKIFGRGLEYTVYDIGAGRVRARRNAIEEQDDVLCSWLIEDAEKRKRIAEAVNVLAEVSMNIVKTLLRRGKIQGELLGNPIFEEGGADYTRDEATSFSSDYIEGHTLEEGKGYIEKYIALVHTLWSSGVCDSTFKFMENRGITIDGDVIQRYIGEFAFTKGKVLSLIQNQAWLNQNFRFMPQGELKEYAKKRFCEEFTPEKLEKFWPKPDGDGNDLNTQREEWEVLFQRYEEIWG